MAEIVLDRVTKSYPNGATAVKDLSITIADGEFIILVGPSGCGKSTTLNMIAGLEDISVGRAAHRRCSGSTRRRPSDRDIAMVFQSYALYPHMTVRQNIAFPLTLAKVKKAEIAQKVEETAKILDLTDFLDRKPAQLSGGQRQRVAMGRAIVRNPKAFLMDEPLSNLDAKLRVQMRSEIARLQNRLGTTTVYVTHDQTEAMTLGDRVVVLLAGVAQQVGTPEELYNSPANLFVAGFIGSPSMNFFPATPDRRRCAPAVRRSHAHPRGARPAGATPQAEQRDRRRAAGASRGCRADRHLRADPRADVPGERSTSSNRSVPTSTSTSRPKARGAHAAQLAELAADSGVGENEFVARVSTESKVTPGQTMELAFDTSKIAIFDADTRRQPDDRADAARRSRLRRAAPRTGTTRRAAGQHDSRQTDTRPPPPPAE